MTDKTEKIEQAELRLKNLDDFLRERRIEWRERIEKLAKDLRHIDKLTEVSVLVSSYRAILIENIADISIKVRQRWSSYNVHYRQRYHYYITRHDFKLNDKRIDISIQADFKIKLDEIAYLEAQLEYYKEAVKTLDQISWQIKNRIAAENIL